MSVVSRKSQMDATLGRRQPHPYWVWENLLDAAEQEANLHELNKGRDSSRGANVQVTYYFEVENQGRPTEGIKNAAKMLLEHGTVKPWAEEGRAGYPKPAGYDENMSWATDFQLLGLNESSHVEAGLVRVAYPAAFFDKRADGKFALAQFLTGVAGEPFSAFSFYLGAKVVDVRFCESLEGRFPGPVWSNERVRRYLDLGESEPLIGTIVKPKTGLTSELFAASVVEAAEAGARFTKADENMHLSLKELPRYVARVVKELEKAGFDLSRAPGAGRKRFLFAPHVTTDCDQIRTAAKAAIEAGANALMFSPYYSGGFLQLAEIVEEFDVPVYAHTAGMNVLTGADCWGFSPHVMYYLAASFGAAFMQITTMNGYLRPDDLEKSKILESLTRRGLHGPRGMTLAVAGGLGPLNVGINMKALGETAKMFLAGSSVYSHPQGPAAGVEALLIAYRAYKDRRIVDPQALRDHALELGAGGRALLALF